MKSEEVEPQQRTLWHQFTQQRLRAWQPILTPCWIISIYIVCGLIFLCLGIALLLTSRSVTEYVFDYTDIADPISGVGSFSLEIARDMEPPIWLYYQLNGFHQNHRRYVQSRDDSQLRDTGTPKYTEADLPGCKPWVLAADARVLYPCGLVARSVFNDTFAVVARPPPNGSAGGGPGELLLVDSAAEAIAWATDAHGGRFRNLDPEASGTGSRERNELALDMWILQRFPPVACEQTEISETKPYKPVAVARRNETSRSGRRVEVTDCRGYASEAPSCNFVREGVPFNCSGHYRVVRRRDWGIQSGHFIVWMRIAGLPSFRKLWGKVSRQLKAGTVLTVHFQDNFPVREFRGRKAFVISTSSMLGGRNDFLGYGYMVVGSCCLIFGVAFLWRYTVYGSRPLGDPTLLCPGEK
uniref:ALA-interacting subunit n=1 Tax=Pyrodinium bahamense TaxID=73915 RepID=A0A7S0FKI7_9DINO|mmetsp:Transcript_3616/g.9876  ORF Transcript_3616/g.9876 Transcript_3616/m.9876 type:complete len:411 (+) Transcript_3616:61-1293(+)|eukprot:CAMPEP_0179103534 /NCGR_PEP_ID=MMETSP0796-20121207/47979_1 /TAXON_ID=73915 /ORGANISM="Pyrodinium bahamense, Strain pbaha01" /LENGTH=410 /DNA_ID=CAMNT_0020801447 /DNA_START=59 /DNA_END=1291 /DNA_ORIENTATION=+